VKLGNPRPLEALDKARAGSAEHDAELGGQGMSYRATTRALNRLNIKTGVGRQWYDVTVKAALVLPQSRADQGTYRCRTEDRNLRIAMVSDKSEVFGKLWGGDVPVSFFFGGIF
jgi:hypothetical protein